MWYKDEEGTEESYRYKLDFNDNGTDVEITSNDAGTMEERKKTVRKLLGR